MPSLDAELGALARHLGARRPVVLRTWRESIRRDPTLTSGTALPRLQLDDHIPGVLMAFERQLAHQGDGPPGTQQRDEAAAAHGLHRWQQGYDLREVIRELGALNVCMVAELDAYAQSHHPLNLEVMATARRLWAFSCSVDVEASADQYFRLQQTEAAGHIKDLERALQELRDLERKRADLWREAAHDLRGNVGVVSNVTAGLALGTAQGEKADMFMRLLQRNVASLRHLLDDVTGLARLQAGREERQLSHFDTSVLLVELCEGLQPLAHEKGLYLRWDGVVSFAVQGDAVKIRRLAQNLVLNAIKYTHQGGVTVSWGDSDVNDGKRWILTVKDTGPGFHAGPGAPLAGALEQATQLAHGSDPAPAPVGSRPQTPPHHADTDTRPVEQGPGEGIGLSIVKRLAELLDASVELDSTQEQGTAFRILLPRHYQAA